MGYVHDFKHPFFNENYYKKQTFSFLGLIPPSSSQGLLVLPFALDGSQRSSWSSPAQWKGNSLTCGFLIILFLFLWILLWLCTCLVSDLSISYHAIVLFSPRKEVILDCQAALPALLFRWISSLTPLHP